ncbi:MAG: YHYH domain-containing protein [Acinetobacter populi]|nr:YHYH domain-containing protein [Acinetobacter populi]MCH4246290.1 YHYH domain-containing protein [Acinetobacter populi]
MILVLFVVNFSASNSFAHGNGTDAFGCHTDSKTGLRHCH